LLGPDGGTGIFGGKKAAPFCGSIPLAMMGLPFRKNRRRRKRKSSLSRIPAINHWKIEL